MATKKIFIPGKGDLSLSDSDHIATGGEGSVYIKKGMAIKLFTDPAKAQQSGMDEKIKLLAAIKHPFIIAPESAVYDSQQMLAGYTMPIAAGIPLMKTFANNWRDQTGFGISESAKLVDNMREAVQSAHALGALLVDGNELNYMADGIKPQLIDVDSWQIGRFKATALMPSVKDHHNPVFSTETDWFSWAVVTFQVFTGIHPYKGTHPDFKKGDMEGRMKANASVFDSRVKLNSAVRDIGAIPAHLRAWYEDVFQRGERVAPPSALLTAAPANLTKKLKVVTSSAGKVTHERIISLGSAVRHVSANGVAFYLEGKIWKAMDLHRKQNISTLSHAQIEMLFANQAALVRHNGGFVVVEKAGTNLIGTVLMGNKDPQPKESKAGVIACSADKLVVFGNRVFALNNQSTQGMTELSLLALGDKTILATKAAWPVIAQSTKFYDGLGVWDALGKAILVVPHENAMAIHRAPELEKYKVVGGYSRGPEFVLLNAVSRDSGKLYRLQFSLVANEFKLQAATEIDDPDLNVSVNSKGILVGIFEDGEVTVTATASGGSKVIADNSISKDQALFSLPEGIFYYTGADIFKFSLS